jgi:hypothetical protein
MYVYTVPVGIVTSDRHIPSSHLLALPCLLVMFDCCMSNVLIYECGGIAMLHVSDTALS